jgi:hypothetical protein
MQISEIEHLDALSDDQLWDVAANVRNNPDIRHEAIQRWLFPGDSSDSDQDGGARLKELRRRATVLPNDELEEDDIEELYRTAPYFDGQGRLILEHDGVQYLIDSDSEDMDLLSDEDIDLDDTEPLV